MGHGIIRLLLDSHVFLWLDHDPTLIPIYQRDTIADPGNEVFISSATAWELGIKQSKGKLRLAKSVIELRAQFGFKELTITFAHATYAAGLPPVHKDPFDRMLVGQAMVEGLVLVTADQRLAEYGVRIL